ncbi:nitroreductase family protein [Neisseria sp. DTU_2021_1001991_1_SI_NGA_ILE_055]|uniref:nitroreductase family protein n=1 Tax=Neisseria sp. DTU_2021_1001991_1_SI_NGA_ILE_055 TaxID=3077590 RepID=UPI0028E8D9BA|nr:nitroreductase family protein [Neisseria sp. DTU_2021_1001991_1_SI_NGA_ILE_055]WNS82597.1 nitroreductase family protein [Neisseria sp. DTU_2021_1001991_1_SI_NGA_ILE_055]
MDALNLLTTRRSSKKLTAPAPNAEQLEQMLQAATQVPDHGNMRPYRFTVIQSETGLQRFRELLSKTVTELNFGDDAMKKAERVGNMAPMIIGVTFVPNREVAKPKPEWEQMLTAGCAAYALQLAASAQGFDNVWITGMWVNSPLLREAFECTDKDKIIGLMMIGSPTEEGGGPKNTNLECFTTYW